MKHHATRAMSSNRVPVVGLLYNIDTYIIYAYP